MREGQQTQQLEYLQGLEAKTTAVLRTEHWPGGTEYSANGPASDSWLCFKAELVCFVSRATSSGTRGSPAEHWPKRLPDSALSSHSAEVGLYLA